MPARITTLHDLFVRELRDLLHAEKRLIRELPRAARAATDPDLRSAIDEHTAQTREHASRLQRILHTLGRQAKPERCEGIEGLLKEAQTMREEADGPAVRDAALIAGLQRVEHYEIAAYGCARAFANQLQLDQAVGILDQTIGEEGAADKALTDIAHRRVNPEASVAQSVAPKHRAAVRRPRRRQRPTARTLTAR